MADDTETTRGVVDISERQFPRSAPSLPTQYPDLEDDLPQLPNTEPNSASSSSNASTSYFGSSTNSPARSYRSNGGPQKRPVLRDTLTMPKRQPDLDDPDALGTPTPVQEPPPPPSAVSPATPMAKDRPASFVRRRATVHHTSIPIDPDLAAYIPVAVQRALVEERRRAQERHQQPPQESDEDGHDGQGEQQPPPSGGTTPPSSSSSIPAQNGGPPPAGFRRGHMRTMSDAAQFRPPPFVGAGSTGSVTILSVERRASCETGRPPLPQPLERTPSFKKPFANLRNMFNNIGTGFVKGHNRTRSQQYDRSSMFRGATSAVDPPRLSFTFPPGPSDKQSPAVRR